jgi:hypothetical protein
VLNRRPCLSSFEGKSSPICAREFGLGVFPETLIERSFTPEMFGRWAVLSEVVEVGGNKDFTISGGVRLGVRLTAAIFAVWDLCVFCEEG